MDIDVFPNSIEYWGPTGDGFLSQCPGPLDALADRFRVPFRYIARTAGRERRRR